MLLLHCQIYCMSKIKLPGALPQSVGYVEGLCQRLAGVLKIQLSQGSGYEGSNTLTHFGPDPVGKHGFLSHFAKQLLH